MKVTADTITHGNARHGHSRSVTRGSATPTYRSWVSMLARCSNPNASNYARYGGRGIRVCERWRSFESFLADVGHRPAGATLDRFPNPNGDYEPGNVRWATAKQQAESRRPAAEWSERPGPKHKTHCKRGHAMTAANTRLNNGRHVCRECASMHDRNRKTARRSS